MKIRASRAHAADRAAGQVLGLDGDVEAGGRLVGDEQARLAGDGDGAHDALAHAARELVGILPDALGGGGDSHGCQQVHAPWPRRSGESRARATRRGSAT